MNEIDFLSKTDLSLSTYRISNGHITLNIRSYGVWRAIECYRKVVPGKHKEVSGINIG